jgi:hypothetical protein
MDKSGGVKSFLSTVFWKNGKDKEDVLGILKSFLLVSRVFTTNSDISPINEYKNIFFLDILFVFIFDWLLSLFKSKDYTIIQDVIQTKGFILGQKQL